MFFSLPLADYHFSGDTAAEAFFAFHYIALAADCHSITPIIPRPQISPATCRPAAEMPSFAATPGCAMLPLIAIADTASRLPEIIFMFSSFTDFHRLFRSY